MTTDVDLNLYNYLTEEIDNRNLPGAKLRECVMNSNCILNENETYYSYSCCICCEPGSKTDCGNYICHMCYKNCHKNHNDNHKPIENNSKITMVKCSCAENSHRVEQTTIMTTKIMKSGSHCLLAETFWYLNSRFLFEDVVTKSKTKNKNKRKDLYCLYCMLSCQKEDQSSFRKVFIEKYDPQGNHYCSCKSSHKTFLDEFGNLEKFVNYYQLQGHLLSKPILSGIYIDPIITVHKKLYDLFKTKNYIELADKSYIREQYLNSFELLYKTAKYIEYNCQIPNQSAFIKSIDMDFLDMIFTLEDIDDSFLISTKTKCLFYYRAFYLNPLTKVKTTSKLNAHWKNVNPLHRLLMKRDLNDFFDMIKINKYAFFAFFIKVSSTVLRYHGKADDTSYINLVIEYLKWCAIIVSMRYTDVNDYDGFFMKDIFNDHLVHLFAIIQENKVFANKCRKYISLFTRSFILSVNDEVLFKRIFTDVAAIREKDEALAFQLSKDKNFTMLKMLPLRKEIDDIFEDKNNWELYDILFNADDFYLENLHSLIESKQSMNYDIRGFFKPITHITSNKYFDNYQQINNFYKLFETIEKLKCDYVNAQITELYFAETILETLHKLHSQLAEIFPSQIGGNINNEDLHKMRLCQMFLFKMNFMDSLIIVSFIFTRNNYLKNYIRMISYENILTSLFDNVILMVNHNPFLVSTLFTTDSIKSIIDKPEISPSLRSIRLEFYHTLLRILHNDKYKLNYEDFLTQLGPYFEVLRASLYTMQNDFPQKHLIELNLLVICFNKCLKTATEKSKYKTSSMVSIMIKSIINSAYLESIINAIAKRNYNTLPLPEKNLLFNVIKVITNLEDYIFYSLNILKIMSVIVEMFKKDELHCNMGDRKTLSLLYAKYYLLDSFYILKIVRPKHLDNMNIVFDQNLRGRLNVATENEENEEGQTERKRSMKREAYKKMSGKLAILKKSSNCKLDELKRGSLNGSLVRKSKEFKEEVNQCRTSLAKRFTRMNSSVKIRDTSKSKEKRRSNERSIDKDKSLSEYPTFIDMVASAQNKNRCTNLLGLLFTPKDLANATIWLNPLFQNMERFKRYYKQFKMDYFMKKPKNVIKYFIDLILYPSLFALFKIIYFSTNINYKLKYLAYKIIYLYLKCYHFLLTEILVNIRAYRADQESFDQLLHFINKDKDILETTLNLQIKDLTEDLHKFDINEYEPCKFNLLMKAFFKYIPSNLVPESSKENDYNNDPFYLHNQQNTSPLPPPITLGPTQVLPFKTLLSSDSIYTEMSLYTQEMESTYNSPSNTKGDNNASIFYNQLKSFIVFYNDKKEDMDINILLCLFKTETNDDENQLKKLKNDIILDMLLFYYENTKISSIWKEDAYILLDIINKLFIEDPDLFHEIILNNIGLFSKEMIYSMIKQQLLFLFQIVIIDFQKLHKPNSKSVGYAKKNFLSIIEFLRLLCENHTKIFQILLTKISINQDELTLLSFILKIPVIVLKNIRKYDNMKNEYISLFKDYDREYFYPIFDAISDYLIEIIQGSLESNMISFKSNQVFENYYQTGYQTLGFLGVEENEYFLCTFFRFLNCFFEENLNPKESKIEIIKKFRTNKLLNALVFSTTKLCVKYNIDPQSPRLVKLLLNLYITQDNVTEDCHFIISSEIFKIFKTAIQWKEGIRFKPLFTEIKEEKNMNIKNIFTFYDTIIKEVEVSYKFKDNQFFINYHRDLLGKEIIKQDENNYLTALEEEYKRENKGIQKVVYLVHRESLFIKDKDLDPFLEHAPSDQPHIKLHYLLKYIPFLQDEILFRRILFFSQQDLKKKLYHINYQLMNYISIFLAIVINFFMLVFTYQTTKTGSGDVEASNYSLIFTVNIIQCLFNFSILGIWFYFTMLRFKIITKLKTYDNLINTLSAMNDSKIICIVWNLTMGIVAILSEKLFFMFSLELFSIASLFETMQIALNSVRMRSKQFFSATFMILVLTFAFAYIKFYWFTTTAEDDCNDLLLCLLTITSGIRDGSGMSFAMKNIDTPGYFSEVIVGWLFYFSVLLIMLNVINGIIVDTFQALREQNNTKSDIKNNVCYVCSLTRAKFESNGMSFEHHRGLEHSIMNYFHYILKILLTDDQDLNSLDYSVLNSVKNYKTDFLPVKHSLSIEQKNERDD